MKRAGILFLFLIFAAAINVSAEKSPDYRNEFNMAIAVFKLHKVLHTPDNDPTKTQVLESQDIVIPTPVEERETRQISVYPNPCIYSMKVSGLNPGDEIIIYNNIGQIVMTLLAENETETIDVSNMPPGIYHLAIVNSMVIDKLDFIK